MNGGGFPTSRDVEQLKSRGVEIKEAIEQIETLRNPPAAVVLVRPCTVGDGVLAIDETTQNRLQERGSEAALQGRVTKFVPASGAASRMFKDLVAALANRSEPPSESSALPFFQRLDDFPFAAQLKSRSGIEQPSNDAEERQMLRVLLEDLGYARTPKGLIPFHRSEDAVRTAFEEHLIEACRFAAAADGSCRAHFTVSADAVDQFERELQKVQPAIEEKFRCRLAVEFSLQHPATDTLAIETDGEPFRCPDEELLFRPGGHGALIRNVEALGGDIVSIKNIDNVLPATRSDEALRWKRILVGIAAEMQERLFAALRVAREISSSQSEIDEAMQFAATSFHRKPPGPVASVEEKRAFLIEALNRPLRVCGVVKNEGEPGGAPFWVRGSDGSESIQIVESSQVNHESAGQRAIFNSSSHFNPVDIVCALRDEEGKPFRLADFIDRSSVFVSTKFHDGRELRALELPGLWNGAMAAWNTVCVEVPGSTFAPVKTVFDLLRPQHQ